MEFWEFLIQREGDRSWLPLESPDVEVLEGRYRMVARTSRANQSVEIRISHICLEEQPPRRRTQKRQAQVNPDGLIVVFPFTRLQPGVWELSCAGDLMADMMGQGWRYGVQLSVLPHGSDAMDDWEPDPATMEGEHPILHLVPDPPRRSEAASTPWDISAETVASEGAIAPPDPLPPFEPPPSEPPSGEPEFATTDAERSLAPDPLRETETADVSPSDPWQQAQADSDAVMDALLEDLDLEVESSAIAQDTPEPEPEIEAPPRLNPEALHLVLQQSSVMVQPDQSLTIQGTVELVGELEIPYLPPVALQITLRDPQTSAILLEVRRSLVSRLLPCPFSCKVTLPEPPQTRLLVGDVALITLATPGNDPAVLVSANFTATASLHELLEAIADDFPAELYPPLREDEQPVDLDVTFLIAQRATAAPLSQRSGQQILPPQLYQPDPDRPRTKGIELPLAKLPEPETRVEATTDEEANSESGSDISDDIAAVTASEAEQPEAIAPAMPRPPLDTPDQPETLSQVLEEADVVLQHLETPEDETPRRTVENLDAALSDSNLALSAEDLAFRALDLQNRFLSRLTALAGDRELSQFLGNSPLTPTDESWDQQEIVIDDDVPLPPLRSSIRFQPPPLLPREEFQHPPIMEEEVPLPTPELRVSGGELVSGQRVDVTVVLPATAARLGVKLWMQDLQNRALLDGPRWVMNFLPNGQGQVEAWAKMTVPHGCLEVQIEAIAVELTTQRESRKATVDRAVVPPDLPTLSFDELEI